MTFSIKHPDPSAQEQQVSIDKSYQYRLWSPYIYANMRILPLSHQKSYEATINDPYATPETLANALADHGYLAGNDLATLSWLGHRLERPILLEGEPGTGKTALAEALAKISQTPLIRLQCYEGIDVTQALYDWDFPRQILHLRTIEALGTANDLNRSPSTEIEQVEAELFSERFLVPRPVLQALRAHSAVLLIDEIDRADDEFEAFLLEVLSSWQITIPEIGTIVAKKPPMVVLTSNRTRELHDALKRRCLYQWIDYPSLQREIEIVRTRLPDISDELVKQVVEVTQKLRNESQLLKPPGTAETLDWARALHALGASELDPEVAAQTMGAAIKYHEDSEPARQTVNDALAGR